MFMVLTACQFDSGNLLDQVLLPQLLEFGKLQRLRTLLVEQRWTHSDSNDMNLGRFELQQNFYE
jgi:hypothetical protein